MKITILSLLLTLVCGCAPHFIGVTDAAAKGGIIAYDQTSPGKTVTATGLNYLIKSNRDQNTFYGSASIGGRGFIAIWRSGDTCEYFPIGGKLPCHLAQSPDGKFLYAADYSAASVAEITLDSAGKPVAVKHINHTGHGADKRRQDKAHPHFAGFSPAGDTLFVVDLGVDAVFAYPFRAGAGIVPAGVERIATVPGSGPRHMVFAPDGRTFYTSNELNNTVSSFIIRDGKWRLAQTVGTLGAAAVKPNYPGAIRITNSGRYILLANRGENNIAVLETGAEGTLLLHRNIPCGNYPRDIALSPAEDYLITADQFGKKFGIHKFDPEQGKASFHAATPPTAASPACIVFR